MLGKRSPAGARETIGPGETQDFEGPQDEQKGGRTAEQVAPPPALACLGHPSERGRLQTGLIKRLGHEEIVRMQAAFLEGTNGDI